MNSSSSVSLFWVVAALFVLVAMAFVLFPLLSRKKSTRVNADRRAVNIAVCRDQLQEMEADRANGLLSNEQFEIAKLELENRLAEDALGQENAPQVAHAGSRTLGYVIAVVLPVAAFGLYYFSGSPALLNPAAVAPPTVEAMPSGHDIEKMVEQAEAKVKANPADGESWAMLGRSYAAMQRWPEAWKAYQFAADRLPEDASLLSGQAEALAIIKGGALQGEPMKLVEKALMIDANDFKALELAAASAFQEKNYAQAAVFLKRLGEQLPPSDPYSQKVKTALARAEQLAQGGGLDNLSQPAATPPPSTAALIRGSIDVAAALKPRIGAQDTIFLFARAAEGGPPVAVVRGPATRFPMDFELSDSAAMTPGDLLSGHKQVTLVARISKSGNAQPQPGDIEGSVAAVKVGAQGVHLVIDKTI